MNINMNFMPMGFVKVFFWLNPLLQRYSNYPLKSVEKELKTKELDY